MPKTYRVGSTDYQFPDNYTDTQVQSILSQQGVIKTSSGKTAGSGKTGARLKGTPSGLGESFMGTLSQDLASVPQAVYGSVAHPFDTASGMLKSLVNLPSDLATDIKQGKYGKLGARALELILPGIGSERAAELANAANESAGRTAARITASKAPEAVGAELKSTLTPDIIKRIRARLKPAEAETPKASPARRISPPALQGSSAKRLAPPERPSVAPPPLQGSSAARIPEPEVPAPARRVAPPPLQGSSAARATAETPKVAPTDIAQSLKAEMEKSGTLPSPAGRLAAPLTDAGKLARWLKDGGITAKDVSLMDSGDWELAAHGAGVKLSPDLIDAAIEELGGKKPGLKVRRRKAGQ